MDNISQIKAILSDCGFFTIYDFQSVNVIFDETEVKISGIEFKNGDLVEAEKRLERTLVLHNS